MNQPCSAPIPDCVGVAVSSKDSPIFYLVEAALKARGVSVVTKICLPEPPRTSLWHRLLLTVDQMVSALLPGSVRPEDDDTPGPTRHTPSLAASVDVDRPVGAIIVVGVPTPALLSAGCDVFRLDLGTRDPRYPQALGAVEVLSRQQTAILSLTSIKGRSQSFTGGAMMVQVHLHSIYRTGSTLIASLPDFLEIVLRAVNHSDDILQDLRTEREVERPSWTTGVRHLATLFGGLAERLLFRYQWVLACMPAPTRGQAPDWNLLQPIRQPDDRIWADPFLVRRDGKSWLFFEDAPFRSAKGVDIGHISVVELGASGLVDAPRTALDLPTHLSYPNVFEYEGGWYMMPETGTLGRVEVYHCTHWPDVWLRHSTLLENYQGYDASIVKSGASYWLFVARRAPGVVTTDFLDLFSSTSPLGPWKLHPTSPIIRDVRRARPGGRPLKRGATILRPAQDSSGGVYGRALRMQRVTRLDAGGFEEAWGATLQPNRAAGAVGIHSLAWDDEYIVVDICRRIPRIAAFRFMGGNLGRPLVTERPVSV